MFLSILYVAVFLDVTHAGEFECPNASTTKPCKCQSGMFGFTISCESGVVYQVVDQLGKTNHRVFYWTFQHVHMPNVPSELFVGTDTFVIRVRECNVSTVDENAFVAVAASLEWLFITGNPLERIPSQALQKLSRLKYLMLDDNAIQVIQPEAFKGLHSLLKLSLSGNRINFIHDSAFAGIEGSLDDLILSGNELTAVPGQPLSNLGALQVLDLDDNKIASLIQEDFDATGGELLVVLKLANNTIKNVPARVFRSLKKLRLLDLSWNAIDAMHPLAFEGNEDTLEVLRFDNNRLEEIPTESLKILKGLDNIDLHGNSICKVQKHDFLPHGETLKHINLQNNSLKYVDPEAFVGLDVLRSLLLQSNKLNAASFETYSPVLDTIQFFDIHDNPLHCDCSVTWLADWINGNGSGIVEFTNETSCATPQEHAKKLLREIPSAELVCGNSRPKFSESCSSNSVTIHQKRLSGDGFATVLQLSFTLLVTVVFEKGRWF